MRGRVGDLNDRISRRVHLLVRISCQDIVCVCVCVGARVILFAMGIDLVEMLVTRGSYGCV